MGEETRKLGLLASCLFVITLVFFAVGMVYFFGVPKRFFWWGCALGIGFGLITSAYLQAAWDPVNLRPKNGRNYKIASWAGIAIIGGIIASRIAASIFGDTIQALLFACAMTWVVWTLSYMTILAWWYRPK